MTIFIVILAWIVLSLFGWSLVYVAAEADRNSSVRPMRPWAPNLIVPREDATMLPVTSPATAGATPETLETHAVRVRA